MTLPARSPTFVTVSAVSAVVCGRGDDLDGLHHGHRVEEVHTGEELLAGLEDVLGELLDDVAGGVAGEDGLGLDDLVELLEDLLLQLEVLGDGLDDHVDVREVGDVGGEADAGHGFVALVEAELADLDGALHAHCLLSNMASLVFAMVSSSRSRTITS